MPESRLPHILFILADNLGWGELGCYGGGSLRGAPTPRIDRLAAEGIRFLNFNVESDCVPTRSALMTGRAVTKRGPNLEGGQAQAMALVWLGFGALCLLFGVFKMLSGLF